MSSISLAPVAFIGLGMMGFPMASRLVEAGIEVRGFDLSAERRDAFSKLGGRVAESPAAAVDGCSIVFTMLPNSDIVEDVLFGRGAAAAALPPGVLIVEMRSAAPQRTVDLASRLESLGVALVDCPVSGGVARARKGALAIMAGGEARDIERAGPLLALMGSSIIPTGKVGSGHAMKALNNYVSAAGLVAACEALLTGQAFGIDPEVIVDVLNASTGRNNATENKLKPFVLSQSFNAGFAMALMAKDIRTAADLAASLKMGSESLDEAADFWEAASRTLGPGADHTAICLYLATRSQRLAAELG